MPVYTYKAKDLNNQNHQGDIDATTEHAALSILRKKGLIVTSIALKPASSNELFDKIFNRVGFGELVVTTRQLATMVGAGLSLSEALDILQEQQTNRKLKTVLGDISHDIKGGLALHQALGRHPEVFPDLYTNLVASGEASGKLDTVMLRMADNLEKEREFRARVKGALIYPIMVIIMMFGVMLIMIIFVIPKLTAIYKESTLELPLPTKILIGVSDFFVGFWWLVLLISIGIVIGVNRWKKTPTGALDFDKLLLKIPIVGKIIISVTLANFARTFGLLVSAGIPLLEGINIVQGITGNMVFKQALKASYSGVERGLTFSAQIMNLPIFPKIVGQMVRVGEETGKVDEIFFKLADYFESESDHMVKNLTVAIEPIILVFLGLGVAFLVLSIILPIYKLTTSF